MTDTGTPDQTEVEQPAAESSTPAEQGLRQRLSSRPVVATIAAVSTLAAVVFAALWITDDSSDELAALQESQAVQEAAENAASQYALGVSQVNAADLDTWRRALQANVSDQLKPKLDAAVDVVGPWLSEMDYTSTANLLAADVQKQDGDTFVVQVFVDMNSKSRQSPSGVTATASYTVTLDRASNWTITDVGGVGAELPVDAAPPADTAPPAPAPAPAGG
ncbi:hypothetical protein [Aldersonia kunmingensis]|uniref:hypothetical protein n=1 Tax=Aldersonia kunmingensis TaxID=408066 RepID=UPI00082E7CD6|nr:hypothetical protein [Aldersonia kunmingensis]